ncbi:hypothetical protein [Bradyrhizobium viridifuturi]|uniref:hypothetical protein n=1 Tax=Bradyrhizobium viridifuturi TaxID=1654716 RepID=UPI000AE238AD|nr:hypothetical protein [Bradyrhizobium viridifuturi]
MSHRAVPASSLMTVAELAAKDARGEKRENNPMQSSRPAAGARPGGLTRRANQGHISNIPKSRKRPTGAPSPANAGSPAAIAAGHP